MFEFSVGRSWWFQCNLARADRQKYLQSMGGILKKFSGSYYEQHHHRLLLKMYRIRSALSGSSRGFLCLILQPECWCSLLFFVCVGFRIPANTTPVRDYQIIRSSAYVLASVQIIQLFFDITKRIMKFSIKYLK